MDSRRMSSNSDLGKMLWKIFCEKLRASSMA
jgi:hypothetical protein